MLGLILAFVSGYALASWRCRCAQQRALLRQAELAVQDAARLDAIREAWRREHRKHLRWQREGERACR